MVRWASAGGLRLTGPSDGPGLGPPAGMVEALDGLEHAIRRTSASVGSAVHVDALAELGARASLLGHRRAGRETCGGAGRLHRCVDGWVALSLPRDSDRELLPALLGYSRDLDEWCRGRTTADVEAKALLLGMAVGVLPRAGVRETRPPVVRLPRSGRSTQVRRRSVRVLDLSSLWAGPLCTALLAAGGHDVVKVESTRRPDGLRSGPKVVHDRFDGGKRSVALDLSSEEGVGRLRSLVAGADVVVTACRPRVWRQWGLDPRSEDGPTVWLSITGHGVVGAAADRIGFGDDAAVAGGLVAMGEGGPWFCADAIADPLTGLVAAREVYAALAEGGQWFLDVAMSSVAAAFAAPTLPVPAGTDDTPQEIGPVAGRASAAARPLGADNDEVFADWLR